MRIAAVAMVLCASRAAAQKLEHAALTAAPVSPAGAGSFRLSRPDSVQAQPSGMQIVAGYMSAMLLGFVAWKAYDEPAGHHTKVKDDWGYTPRAHTALGVGSFVGATLGVWGTGRTRGAKGKLWSTALGAAIPTLPILLRRDDPLLPFMAAIFGMPVQGIGGYLGYRATAR